MDAVAPRYMHVVIAVEHMDAVESDVHLFRSALARPPGPRPAFAVGRRSVFGRSGGSRSASRGIGCARRLRCARKPSGARWHAGTGSAREPLKVRSARNGALCRTVRLLELDIFLDASVYVQKVVERNPVQLREGNKVIGIGRRLGSLPFRNRLPGNPELFRQAFLGKPRFLTPCREALRDLYVHHRPFLRYSFILPYPSLRLRLTRFDQFQLEF